MIDRILALGWSDVVIAASIAYAIFSIISKVQKGFIKKDDHHTYQVRNINMAEVNEKCRELFPIQSLTFRGKEFSRGARIKIITIQKKIIEGELVGINQVNIVCIRTHNQIIAHQLEKIEEIIDIE